MSQVWTVPPWLTKTGVNFTFLTVVIERNGDVTSTIPMARCLRCGTMKYQLVLQFAAASMEDFDRLVALEDRLIEELDDVAAVDGHDFGLGAFNIFILTNDPAESFGKAHRIVTNEGVPNVIRSAYREVDGEDYVILWPSSLTEFSVL